jgi:uncharacterized protein YndB with AHSA1/START domain
MLKWILGCLGLGLVIVAVAVWFGYQKVKTFADAGPASTVIIAAPPERIFASMADADSMPDWRSEGLGIRASHKGILRVGDTLETQAARASSRRASRIIWIVSDVTPNVLLATDAKNDSGVVMFTRRDSLWKFGDSTMVVTTFAAPGIDSLRARNGDKVAAGGMVAKLLVAGLRLASEQELTRLKTRIEALPGTRPPTPD